METEKRSKIPRNKIKLMVEGLERSTEFQAICRYFPVELWIDPDKLLIYVPLLDRRKRQVDAITLETNSDGFIHPGVAVYWLVVAFQMGLTNEMWKRAGKRIRKSEFQ